MLDYYKIFDVKENATQGEIEQKYHFHIKTWNPDKFDTPEDKTKALEKLQQLNRIYLVLSNPVKRKKYDQARVKKSKEYKRGRILVLSGIGIAVLLVLMIVGMSFLPGDVFAFLNPAPTHSSNIALPLPTSTPLPAYSVGSSIMSAKDGMSLVYIPEGEFQMGSDVDNGSVPNPTHSVYLDAYWIDQTEVTNAMYAQCVEVGACNVPRKQNSHTREWYYSNPEFDNYPVLHVSWEDANAYCRWARRRLPTEAEWEKAASWDENTQTKRLFPWGNEFAGSNLNSCDTNCPISGKNAGYDDGYGDTSPVKSYMTGQSFYGAYDMAGNVWEWVADWYGENYYMESPESNPQGPSSGTYRLLRGGAWSSGDAMLLATSFREGNFPDTTDANLGFRCAKSP